jgi:hypothetical protein
VLRQQFQFQQDGTGSLDEWAFRSQGMLWIFRQGSGTRKLWREFEDIYPAALREVIDGLIR